MMSRGMNPPSSLQPGPGDGQPQEIMHQHQLLQFPVKIEDDEAPYQSLVGPQPPVMETPVAPFPDKAKFLENISRLNRMVEMSPIVIDGIQIDLYQLHIEVMTNGGSESVSSRVLWPEVARALGLQTTNSVYFLLDIYNRYLLIFERSYVATYRQQQRNFLQARAAATPNGVPYPNGVVQQPYGVPEQKPNPAALQGPPLSSLLANTYATLRVPTSAQLDEARALYQKMSQEFDMTRNSRPLPFKQLSDQDRAEFPEMFGSMLKVMKEVDMYKELLHAFTGNIELAKRLVTAIATAKTQDHLLSQQPPMYIMDLPYIASLHSMFQAVYHHLSNIVSSLKNQQVTAGPSAAMQQPRGVPEEMVNPDVSQGLPHSLLAIPSAPLRPPTSAQMDEARALYQRMFQDFDTMRNSRPLPFKQLPDQDRAKFPEMFGPMLEMMKDMDQYKELFYAFTGNIDLARRLVSAIATVRQQEYLLSKQPPIYIMDLSYIASLHSMLRAIYHNFSKMVFSMKDQRVTAGPSVATPSPHQPPRAQALPIRPPHPQPTHFH